MQSMIPLACFLSVIRPPGVQYENALLQLAPVDKAKCPYVKDGSDVAYQLFTRHNPTVYQQLALNDDEKLFASSFDWAAPTVFYFHAFMEQPEDGSGIMVREAYMQRGDTNVVMVAAARLEAGPWYFTAAQNTWYIGRHAANFIDYMVSRGLQLNNTHLVGHSLGAQAAGVAGSALKSGRVSRITGLDPALPLFRALPLQQRLDAGDAHFVDVIHTDAGIFGWKEPIGHADFYPNGGQSPQPGCELEVVIPQQLLLNKCDGTEQTRGFYTYYLTSNTEHPHSDNLASNQNIPAQSNLKKSKPDLSRLVGLEKIGSKNIKHLLIAQMHNIQATELNKDTKVEQHVTKINSNTHDVNNSSQKERMKRNINTTTANNTDFSKKGEHWNSQTEIITASDREQDKSGTENPNINNNETKTAGIHTDAILNHNDNTSTNEHTVDRKHITQTNKDLPSNKGIRSLTSNARSQTKQQNDKIKHKKSTITGNKHTDTKVRQKRFLQFFRSEDSDNNFIFRALNFLVKNRRNIVPVVSVVRDINTLVKSGNGELNHVSRERNNYIGFTPPELAPASYTLELGNESKAVAFVKRLFGLSPKGDRLTVGSG